MTVETMVTLAYELGYNCFSVIEINGGNEVIWEKHLSDVLASNYRKNEVLKFYYEKRRTLRFIFDVYI